MTQTDEQPQTRETLVETVRTKLLDVRALHINGNGTENGRERISKSYEPSLAALSVLAARLDTAEGERDEACAVLERFEDRYRDGLVRRATTAAAAFEYATLRADTAEARAVAAEEERDEARGIVEQLRRHGADWLVEGANEAVVAAEAREDAAVEALMRCCKCAVEAAAEARLQAATDALRKILLIAGPAWKNCPPTNGWREPYGNIAGIAEAFLGAEHKALAARAVLAGEDGQGCEVCKGHGSIWVNWHPTPVKCDACGGTGRAGEDGQADG